MVVWDLESGNPIIRQFGNLLSVVDKMGEWITELHGVPHRVSQSPSVSPSLCPFMILCRIILQCISWINPSILWILISVLVNFLHSESLPKCQSTPKNLIFPLCENGQFHAILYFSASHACYMLVICLLSP
jgi:hypothetical protein